MSYGGGGFLQGGSQGGSQSSPGGGKRGPSSLRPVTIHQILNAEQAHPDAEFYLDGSEVKDITFVACVRNTSKSATNIGYVLEDGTGQIDARQWIEQGNAEDEEDDQKLLNKYVRVVGAVKSFQGKRNIHCNRVRVIEDLNEINFHLVECAYVSMFFQGQLTGGAAGGGAGGYAADSKPYVAGSDNPYAAGNAAGGGGGGNSLYNDLPLLQRKIMEFIKGQQELGESDEGVNVNAVARSVGEKVGLQKIREEIEALMNDGHLYQTIDDDHVLPTN